jgi:hypothetical protein
MRYIKNMRLREYELYDLAGDVSQDSNLIGSHPEAGTYVKMINEQLKEIQQEGYEWAALPPPEGRKRIKTDWVKYTRRSVIPDQ